MLEQKQDVNLKTLGLSYQKQENSHSALDWMH